MIEENVAALLEEISRGNPFGEKVTLVAATKTRTEEEVRRAIRAGICTVGENRVQEFTKKYSAFEGAEAHFIGRLQTNKVKYLIGKAALIHSVDRDGLAREISSLAERKNAVQRVLIEVNAGGEESKGGFSAEETLFALERISALPALKVCGLMAMLPLSEDEALLSRLASGMRKLYEEARERFEGIEILSMGMSGDWRLAIANGSNMVRIGTAIFSARNPV